MASAEEEDKPNVSIVGLYQEMDGPLDDDDIYVSRKNRKKQEVEKPFVSKYSGLNRPYAGSRQNFVLPKGTKRYQLYSYASPDGMRVACCLEELDLDFDAHTINIWEADQFVSGFVELNPNSKVPVLVDTEGPNGESVTLFESGNILLYLAEQEGQLIPERNTAVWFEMMNWLFWATQDMSPSFNEYGHFLKYAAPTVGNAYGRYRYTMEAKRLLDLLDRHLEEREFMVGDMFTIADLAVFPWLRQMLLADGYGGVETLKIAFEREDQYTHVTRYLTACMHRPATTNGLRVCPSGTTSIGPYKGPTTVEED